MSRGRAGTPPQVPGGVIYSVGVMLAPLINTSDQLWLLVLTDGAIAGFGLGMVYIVPMAMLVKWFPDKRGLITGIAVGGFGAGAVVTAPVADRLIDPNDVARVFLILRIGYLIAILVGPSFFRNLRGGYAVSGLRAEQGEGHRYRRPVHVE